MSTAISVARMGRLPWLFLSLSLLAPAAEAALRLDCQVDQEDRSWQFSFLPGKDPYRVAAHDINGKFRFKAVVIGDSERLDYVKIYVDYLTWESTVPLQQATYIAPRPLGAGKDALTGRQWLSTPSLEQQLAYGCHLVEVAP